MVALPGVVIRGMDWLEGAALQPCYLGKGSAMKMWWKIGECVSLSVLTFVLLGSSAVAAAQGDSNAVSGAGSSAVVAASTDSNGTGGGAGTNPFTLSGAHEIATQIYTMLVQYGLQVIGAVLIFAVGRWLAKQLSVLAAKLMKRAKVDPTLIPFLENLAYTAMLAFVVIAVLDRLGVATTSAIAVLGAAGLAVGLALQGSLANFASGVLLLVFKPFRVGDFVEIGGAKGTVQAVHLFNAVLNSPDNIRIIVPNAQVTGGSILNYTINGTRRIDLVVGVSYNDDLRKARRVIESVLTAEPRILSEPAPTVAVSEMADSSINLVVRPWVKVADYWDVRFDITEKIKVAIEEHGMTIPFPQRDIYVKTPLPMASVKSA
jgi:small conductance mechanosensitive channel